MFRLRGSIVVLVASLGLGASATVCAEDTERLPAPELDRADLEAWLDDVVPPDLKEGDIAGLVVSVVKDGRVLLEKGYGYADVAAEVPMDPERTVMRAASISKSFTATAVMQLVEQGRLDLDRDVNDYLDVEIPPAFGKPITLRNLLTHTAGFEEISYKRYDPPLTLREHLLTVPERIYPPGEIPAYSNYGLNLAGYIVQRTSEQSVAGYVGQHILRPLRMNDSTFRVTLPERLRSRAAVNYRVASGEPYPPNLIVELSPVDSPSAGLSTTADDMTRFMLAHLGQGRYDGYQLLRPDTLRTMHAPAFVPIRGTRPVALGFFHADYKGHAVIGHSGDGEGFHTDLRLLPDLDVGIFTASNSDGSLEGIIPAAFALRNSLFERFVDRYFPRAPRPQDSALPTAKEHAELAAGEYVWSRQPKGDYTEALFLIGRFLALKTVIRANEDGTIETPASVSLESGPPKRWREVAPFIWQEEGGDARLAMKVEDGQVRSFWVDSLPSFWVNLRVPYIWSAGLNVPLLGLAMTVLLLTTLSWPIAALVRRRYGRTAPLDGREARARRLALVAAMLATVYLLGWAVVMIADAASMVGAAPWIRLLQIVGLLCTAGAAVTVWNAALAFRSDRRGVWATVRSAVLALAMVYVTWFSFAFHLISIRLS